MEESAENQHHVEKKSLKEKFYNFCQNFSFPITIEPLVFFFTLSVGLNEVGIEHISNSKLELDSTLSQSRKEF